MVVVHVVSHSEMDPEDYKQKIPVIRETLPNQKVQQYVAYWYDNLKVQSTIEDYRNI